MPALIDLTGQVFTRLTVETRSDRRYADGHILWRCRCNCGTVKDVSGSDLRGGKTLSCGCLMREVTRRRSTVHGHAPRKRVTPEYRSWFAMVARATNPNGQRWEHYGGRGVTVCAPWRESFAAFLADMGPKPTPRHSIDRIDVNGNYEPGNCRWATQKEQCNNKRCHSTAVA